MPKSHSNNKAEIEKKPDLSEKSSLTLFLEELKTLEKTKDLRPEQIDPLYKKYNLKEKDFFKIEQIVDQHMTRASSYIKRERWDSAIIEVERALLFFPSKKTLRLKLAKLYLKKSENQGFLEKDILRAEEALNEILRQDPQFKSAKEELKKIKNIQKNKKIKKKGALPLILLFTLLLLLLLFPLIKRQFDYFKYKDQPSTPLTETEDSIPLKMENQALNSHLTENLQENISINLIDKTLSQKEGEISLSLKGYIKGVKEPIEQLSLLITLGDPLHPDRIYSKEVLNSDMAPLTLENTLSFSEFIYLDTPLKNNELTISIDSIKSYSPTKKSLWIEQKIDPQILPKGAYLKVRTKEAASLEGFNKMYLFLDIEFENGGLESLKEIEVQPLWLQPPFKGIKRVFFKVKELPLQAKSQETRRLMISYPKGVFLDSKKIKIKIISLKKDETIEN